MGHVPHGRPRLPARPPRWALAVLLAFMPGSACWFIDRASPASSRPGVTGLSCLLVAALAIMAARIWRGLR